MDYHPPIPYLELQFLFWSVSSRTHSTGCTFSGSDTDRIFLTRSIFSQNISYIISNMVFDKNGRGHYYYPHFSDKKNKTKKVQRFAQGNTMTELTLGSSDSQE